LLGPKPDSADSGVVGMCPIHPDWPLDYHCNTHDIDICKECRFEHHPRTKCELLPFTEDLEDRRKICLRYMKAQQSCVTNAIEQLDNNSNIMGILAAAMEEEAKRLHVLSRKIQRAAKEGQNKLKTLSSTESDLQSGDTYESVNQECKKVYGQVEDSQEWVAPVHDLLVTYVPEVFMYLTYGGRHLLGRIHIRLRCHSLLAQQFLAICLGTQGPTYVGSNFDRVILKGQPGESLACRRYRTDRRSGEDDAEMSDKPIMSNLKTEGKSARKAGSVFLCGSAGFMICTKDFHEESFSNPLGEVILGLAVVRAAVGKEFVQGVSISGAGLVLQNQ
ncbi:unnamed protein product, partial [Meganyctiphanes norvegica]